MSAVSLMNLRQDAGFLATTAGGAPFVMTHPWVLPDLPLVFESLHETVDKAITLTLTFTFGLTRTLALNLHPHPSPLSHTLSLTLTPTLTQIVTEPFLRNWIDTMCIFCGFPAKGAMTAHILYILDRFFVDGACYLP